MKTKIKLLYDGESRTCNTPFEGYDHAVAAGKCPHCATVPFKVAGTGRRIASDDRAYEADAVALCCSKSVGVIRAEVNTLFGLREDEAVARSGWIVL